MLNKLEVLNGEMSLKFDPLNTIYTINVKEEVTSLKLEYEIGEDNEISIYGNNLKKGLNEVVITVYNDKEQMSYYLEVFREGEEMASEVVKTEEKLEIANNSFLVERRAEWISVVCFIFILLFFTLLFKKNKKCKF